MARKPQAESGSLKRRAHAKREQAIFLILPSGNEVPCRHPHSNENLESQLRSAVFKGAEHTLATLGIARSAPIGHFCVRIGLVSSNSGIERDLIAMFALSFSRRDTWQHRKTDGADYEMSVIFSTERLKIDDDHEILVAPLTYPDRTDGLEFALAAAEEQLVASLDKDSPEAAADRLDPIQAIIARHLVRIIATLDIPQKVPVEEGRLVAKEINELVSRFGFRIKFPKFDSTATLTYGKVGNFRDGRYYLVADIDGRRKAFYFKNPAAEFGSLQLIVAPKRRSRK